MVDKIPPIQGLEEATLVQASFFHPVNATETHSTTASNPEQAPTTPLKAGTQNIDYVRFQQDDDYYLQTMNYTLQNARIYFQNSQYTIAETYYQQFFQYFPFYQPTFGQLLQEYAPALLEYAWLTEIQSGNHETQKLLNQNLLKLLEVSLHPTQKNLEPVQEQIKSLQNQGFLPVAGNLQVNISPTQIKHVAEQLFAMKAKEPAIQLIRFVEVVNMLEVYRAILLANQMEAQEVQPKPLFEPYNLLPFGFRHLGVPIVPSLPQTQEMAIRVSPKTIHPEYRIDKVEPVYAINKDPKARDNRGRRQRRPDVLPQKKKSKLSSSKPQITI